MRGEREGKSRWWLKVKKMKAPWLWTLLAMILHKFWLIMKDGDDDDDDDDDGRLCWWWCSWCYVAWIKVSKMIVTCVIWISNICVMYVVWQSGMDYGIWLCDAINVAYVIVWCYGTWWCYVLDESWVVSPSSKCLCIKCYVWIEV